MFVDEELEEENVSKISIIMLLEQSWVVRGESGHESALDVVHLISVESVPVGEIRRVNISIIIFSITGTIESIK